MGLLPLTLLLAWLTPTQDEAAEFKKRIEEKRQEARERLAEAQRELEAERKAAELEAQSLRRRLAGKPMNLKMRTGEAIPQAIIRASSFSDVEIEVQGKASSYPWDSLAPESIVQAAEAIFESDKAARQFERGRFLIARRLWKEALAAFQNAVKLDEEFESKFEDVREILERMMEGQGAFRGNVRRLGQNGIALTYDFSSDAQLGDFTEGFKIVGKTAVLEGAKGEEVSGLEVEFVGEAEAEFKIAADVPFMVDFFRNDEGMYRATLGFDAVTVQHIAKDGKTKRELGKRSTVKLVKGKTHDVRAVARERSFKIYVDKQEALACSDAAPAQGPAKGYLRFAVDKGKATLHALAIRGLLDPRDIEKRFAEVEILVRRAVDPDLSDVEEMRQRDVARFALGTVDGMKLTADDRFFSLRIGRDLHRYDAAKQGVAEYMRYNGRAGDGVKKTVDELIAAYPEVPSLYYLRALLHYEDNFVPAARKDVDKAIQLFPEFTEALTLRAKLEQWDNEWDAAAASLDQAIDTLPDYASAYVQRALVNYARNPASIGKCLEDLQTAMKLSFLNREAPSLLRTLRYQSKGPKDLGCRFTHESAHYVVMTDISQEAAKLYSERLEAAYRYFAETFKHVYQEKPFRKPRVSIFNTRENYYTYSELLSEDRGENTLGVFYGPYNELILFEDLDLEETLGTLYHEAFHHFTTLMTKKKMPYWWNEGIAEYMSGITVKDGKIVEKAKLLKGRLKNLQMAMQYGFPPLSFKEIMCQTPAQFYSGPVAFKYAQAWAMMHFLYEADSAKYRPQIQKYFDLLREGKWLDEAFDGAFKHNASELETKWKEYVKKLKV